jgi:hypothetical protein
MACNHRRTCVTIALLAALIVVAALAAACSAQATGGARAGGSASTDGAQPGSSSSPAAAGAKGASSDWARVLDALAFMRATPPARPVVVLLGGSAARESTISDAAWRDQIVAKGGPATLAWNMGSRNRTMAQNVAVVKALPKGIKALVYIGINLGSFTSAQKTASIDLPAPAPSSVTLQQPHQYSTKTGILTSAKKRALVQGWLVDRYPVYQRNFATSAGVLETLVKVCQARGYTPVLFELPRNTDVIGGSLNAPTTKYRAKCKALAAKYGIRWVSLVTAAGVPDPSFYDLWHLVEPGRTVWQNLLSANAAKILTSDAFTSGGGS